MKPLFTQIYAKTALAPYKALFDNQRLIERFGLERTSKSHPVLMSSGHHVHCSGRGHLQSGLVAQSPIQLDLE